MGLRSVLRAQSCPPIDPGSSVMDLQNSFVVPADVETAWKTLLDVEKVAPCMPGATLESNDGKTSPARSRSSSDR